MELRDKRVTVVGLARSGQGAASLLTSLGAHVTVTDRKGEEELREAVSGIPRGVTLALGGHPEEAILGADLIVVSPGIPLQREPLMRARENGIPVIGELELSFCVADRLAKERTGGAARFLAVTGSNGKSTTTTLLDLMVRKAGFSTVLAGNIGNALSAEIVPMIKTETPLPDFFVIEVSSFQLEAIESFRPRAASILNITPDHMDRYHSLEEYRLAKARIFENQGAGDSVVLNADDAGTEALAGMVSHRPGLRKIFFSRKREVEGLFLRDGMIVCRIPGLPGLDVDMPLIRAGEIRIHGVHNLENAMAASAMALLAGCSPDSVSAALREFPGLEHRLELVRELDGVRYINDSKGTNVGAVEKSLESFDSPVILIAGGRDKAGDFAALRDLVAARVRGLVLIGEAAGKIRYALGDVTHTVLAADLREAVTISRSIAKAGDVVLLSPACASFDMFRDFEDRGRQFKQIVTELGVVHA